MPTTTTHRATIAALAFVAVLAISGCNSNNRPAAAADSSNPRRPDANPACSGSARADSYRAPEDRRLYRLDFVITTTEPGKAAGGSSHTINIEEGTPAEIRMGSNVPLTPSNARQDVGLFIRSSFQPVGEDLLLQANVEMSAVEDGGAIRKMTLRGDALVSPGKTAVVASTEDPISHKRYEVTAKATKLR